MSKLKEVLRTAKSLVGTGKLKKPIDWPVNPYEVELKKVGGFKETLVATATGQASRSLTLLINAKIINMRDQQVIKYLRSKGIVV